MQEKPDIINGADVTSYMPYKKIIEEHGISVPSVNIVISRLDTIFKQPVTEHTCWKRR